MVDGERRHILDHVLRIGTEDEGICTVPRQDLG